MKFPKPCERSRAGGFPGATSCRRALERLRNKPCGSEAADEDDVNPKNQPLHMPATDGGRGQCTIIYAAVKRGGSLELENWTVRTARTRRPLAVHRRRVHADCDGVQGPEPRNPLIKGRCPAI